MSVELKCNKISVGFDKSGPRNQDWI